MISLVAFKFWSPRIWTCVTLSDSLARMCGASGYETKMHMPHTIFGLWHVPASKTIDGTLECHGTHLHSWDDANFHVHEVLNHKTMATRLPTCWLQKQTDISSQHDRMHLLRPRVHTLVMTYYTCAVVAYILFNAQHGQSWQFWTCTPHISLARSGTRILPACKPQA